MQHKLFQPSIAGRGLPPLCRESLESHANQAVARREEEDLQASRDLGQGLLDGIQGVLGLVRVGAAGLGHVGAAAAAFAA